MDQRNEEFHQWRLRTIESLPLLSTSIFALEPRDLKLEHDFGFAIYKLTDFEDKAFYDGLRSIAKQSAIRINVESINERLAGRNGSKGD